MKRKLLTIVLLVSTATLVAQESTGNSIEKTTFWDNVQFGGGLGLNFGNNATNISVQPSAIYNFNEIYSAGVSLVGGYNSFKNDYKSFTYGGSILGLVNPIREIQLSAELEQLQISVTLVGANNSKTISNTAFYVGGGYRTNNITIGMRYDILYNKNQSFTNSAFTPFIRVFF